MKKIILLLITILALALLCSCVAVPQSSSDGARPDNPYGRLDSWKEIKVIVCDINTWDFGDSRKPMTAYSDGETITVDFGNQIEYDILLGRDKETEWFLNVPETLAGSIKVGDVITIYELTRTYYDGSTLVSWELERTDD